MQIFSQPPRNLHIQNQHIPLLWQTIRPEKPGTQDSEGLPLSHLGEVEQFKGRKGISDS